MTTKKGVARSWPGFSGGVVIVVRPAESTADAIERFNREHGTDYKARDRRLWFRFAGEGAYDLWKEY